MLSIPDMALLGAAALLLFGPDQLPRVARKAGLFMRDVQNTSQSFIREMERAADAHEAAAAPAPPAPFSGEKLAEPRPAIDAEAAAAAESVHGAPHSPAAEPAPQPDHAPHVEDRLGVGRDAG